MHDKTADITHVADDVGCPDSITDNLAGWVVIVSRKCKLYTNNTPRRFIEASI
jgi:hypothetical protein